jgi:hypothetical protein
VGHALTWSADWTGVQTGHGQLFGQATVNSQRLRFYSLSYQFIGPTYMDYPFKLKSNIVRIIGFDGSSLYLCRASGRIHHLSVNACLGKHYSFHVRFC